MVGRALLRVNRADGAAFRARASARAAASRLGPVAAAVAVFVVAFAWRALYLARLAGTPLADARIEDTRIYWSWSSLLLQHGPLGSNPFFLGPLYPYALALLRALTGDSARHVLLIQALWGAAAAALLADAARRLVHPALAIAAGLLVAFYPMAVFFDGLILSESLLFFLESLLLWRVAAQDGPVRRSRALWAIGLLVGLLAEGRATSALLLPVAAATLVGWSRAGWRAAAGRTLVLVSGFALVALPVAVRNRVVSAEWIPFTYNLGYNLYVGNHPAATGAYVSVTGTQQSGAGADGGADGGAELDGREYLSKVEGRDLGPSASSAYWAGKARSFVAAHPGAAARLALTKLGMIWNRREYPQIENADEYRRVAGPLGLPLVGSFAFLGTLALAGLACAGSFGPRGRFVAGYAVAATLGIAPFFVTDRYRHHLVPAAVLLATLAIARAGDAVASRSRGAALRLALAAVAGVVVVHLPAPGLGERDLAWREAADLGARWLDRGRPDLAAPELERAVRIETGVAPRGAAGPLGTLERAALYSRYATALQRLGRHAEALPWHERAGRLAPENAAIVRALADALRDAGRAAEAQALYARLPALVGGEARALASGGWEAARAGRLEEAERRFAAAVRLEPGLYDAWGALVRIRIQLGRTEQAAAALEQAGAAGLPFPSLRAHQALLAALRGDLSTAGRALAEVPEPAIAGDAQLADVVQLTRRLLARSR